MSRPNKTVYEPIDRLSTVPWGFIRLVCLHHGQERPKLSLQSGTRGPFYGCSAAGCRLRLPAGVYEKLLEDVMKTLNQDGSVVGRRWNRQAMRQVYSFEILHCEHETGVTVGVRQLSFG